MNSPHLQSIDAQSPQAAQAERSLLGWTILILGIALAIFVAAKLSQHLTTPPTNASPVWPGAGIALALTLLYGPRAVIGVFLGAAVFEYQLFANAASGRDLGSELILACGLALGASLQALFGALLIKRWIGPFPRLIRDGEILRFQLLGGPLACMVSSSISMTTLWWQGIVTTASVPSGWLTWWVGDTIGAVIFAPLVLVFLNDRDPLWRGRKNTVALPMLLLLATAITFYSYSNTKENEQRQLRFNEEVRRYHNLLIRAFQTHIDVLEFLKSHIDANSDITRDEFRIFTRSTVEKHAGIQALEWIPRIEHAQRAAFERSLPQNRVIRRLDAEGVPRPAEDLAEYYAIRFVEPPANNAAAFGYDITGNPIAAEALHRARDSGRITATGPLRLVQETANEAGIVLYNPVYRTPEPPATVDQRRESITGVAAAVFRVGSLIENDVPAIRKGMLSVRLFDVTGDQGPRLLYSSHGPKHTGPPNGLVEERTFDLAGRLWTLEYGATADFVAAQTTWAVWVVLTGGLLVTAIFGTGLLMLTGRTLRMEGEVIERTAELRAEVDQRRDAETQLRLVLNGANLGFWDWNYQTGKQWVNDRWLDILGLERSDLSHEVGDWLQRIHPEDKARVLTIVEHHIENQSGFVAEFRMRHRDGHWVWIQAAGAAVSHHAESGRPLRLCGTLQDISERRKQEEHVLRQAHFDLLTDLPNRFLALDRLSQLLNEARRNQELVAVLFLDLDDFKKVNDTLGHDTGDKLLKEAASRLKGAVRAGDTVGRLGGDEFIVLLGGLSDATDAQPVAETLLSRFRYAFKIDGREFILTASIGIAIYPNDGGTPSELLRNSDSAMYHSKEQGRNTYSFFTDEMNQGVSRRLLLEEQMHGALSRGEFSLLYQPKIALQTGKAVGVEALLRWHNPTLGQVSPMEFIPIAEQTGLIVTVGQFVLSAALDAAARWKDALGRPISVAVNLSPRQFRDPNLVPFIEESLNRSGVAGAALELEITEGVLMSGHAYIDEALAALNKLGITLAMDDFGTGYSSLSYLRSYPFDVVKIDREFVKDITDDPADRELVNAAIAMAHGLGLKVVAEGVETIDQRELLALQGCDYGQGYLFNRPVSFDEMTGILQAQISATAP